MGKTKLWWVVRRRHGKEAQIERVWTYQEAVKVARRWYQIHGINYGIQIKYFIEEIGRLVEVKDFYLINSVEEIE